MLFMMESIKTRLMDGPLDSEGSTFRKFENTKAIQKIPKNFPIQQQQQQSYTELS